MVPSFVVRQAPVSLCPRKERGAHTHRTNDSRGEGASLKLLRGFRLCHHPHRGCATEVDPGYAHMLMYIFFAWSEMGRGYGRGGGGGGGSPDKLSLGAPHSLYLYSGEPNVLRARGPRRGGASPRRKATMTTVAEDIRAPRQRRWHHCHQERYMRGARNQS